jgi:uncharacterized protein DUF6281
MRWLLALTVALCACGSSRGGGEGACAPAVRWHGDWYMGQEHGHGLRSGGALGEKALSPACNDTNHSHAEDRTTTVDRIDGVDPLFALMIGGTVYLNRATFPVLESHPLHRLYGRERLRRLTGPRCRVRGRLDRYGRVGSAYVRVTSRTDVRLQRGGSGYIREGTPIAVTGRSCHLPHLVTAVRIDPL